MATPIVLFKHQSPVQFTCGVLRDITVSVDPAAVGKGKVRLFITAPSCNFNNGSKEMIKEFTAQNTVDELLVVFNLSITCSLPQIFTITLNAEAINSDGESGNDKITAKANCQPSATTTTTISTTTIIVSP